MSNYYISQITLGNPERCSEPNLMTDTPSAPLLIIDPDTNFLHDLRKEAELARFDHVSASNADDGTVAITRTSANYSGIFISTQIGDSLGLGLGLVQLCVQHRPMTPIFLMIEVGQTVGISLPLEDLRKSSVRNILRKPLEFKDLLAAMTEDGAKAEPQAPAEKPMEIPDADMFSVVARSFFSGSSSAFEVFERVERDLYRPLIRTGGKYSPDLLAPLLGRGEHHIYLRQDAQQQYFKYCDLLASTVSKKEIPPALKIAIVSNLGQQTMAFLRTAGVNRESIRLAESFVSRLWEVTESLDLKTCKPIDKLLGSVVLAEHAVATAIVASLISDFINIKAEKTAHIIGLASLLHDVGLQVPEPAAGAAPTLVWPVEGDCPNYTTHPSDGAAILSKIPQIESTVVQAVEQHHERRDRTGFPHRIGVGKMNRVAEIVGIADECVEFVQRAERNPKINPILEMQRVLPKFSGDLADAFNAIFSKKR